MRWKLILGLALAFIVVAAAVVYALLAGYDLNALKPEIAEEVKAATGREVALDGDIELKIGLTPTLILKDARLLGPRGRPDLAKVRRLELEVALWPLIGGEIEVKRLVVIEPEITLTTDKSGRSNFEFEAPPGERKPDKEPPPPGFTLGRLLIKKGRLVIKNDRTGRTQTLSLDTLAASSQGDEAPLKIELEGRINGRTFTATGRVGPPAALFDPARPWPIDLSGRIFGLDFKIRGAVENVQPGEGRTTANAYLIPDLVLSLGGDRIAGQVTIEPGDDRPRLTARLTSKRLDLRPLLARLEQGRKTPPGRAKKKRLFSKKRLDLGGLETLDADVRLAVGRVLLPKLALADLETRIRLDSGRLAVEPLTCRIGGGKLDGRLEMRTRDEAVEAALTLKIAKLDLGRMFEELDIDQRLTGRIDLDLDLKGRGASAAGLMAGLDGRAAAVMGRGLIDNNYLDLLGGDLASGVFRLLSPNREDGRTQINCFVARFDVEDGLARSRVLVFDTNQMTVVGDGTVNLKTEALDVSLKPAPKKGVGAAGRARISLSLGELAKPFKLGGALAEPRLAVDPEASALAVGKAVGGVALFGPVGLVAALVSRSGEENPCLAALKAIKLGPKDSGGEKTDLKTDRPAERKGLIDEAKEEIGGALKKLFGD